jgi:hypothetical protein
MWPRPTVGPSQPPTQFVQRVPSPRVKRPGSEAHRSPPTGAQGKKIRLQVPVSLHSVDNFIYLFLFVSLLFIEPFIYSLIPLLIYI